MKIHINKTEQLNKMPSSLALFHLKIVIKETIKWTIVKLLQLMLWELMALQTSSLPKERYRQNVKLSETASSTLEASTFSAVTS